MRTKTYFKGNLAEYTGRSEWLYGVKWFEVLMLEGPDAGRCKVVSLAHHDRDLAAQNKQRVHSILNLVRGRTA